MFGHIFKYRFKTLLRDRGDLFWTAIYPIVLSIFFFLAFSNMTSADSFKSFPIGVVDNEEYRSQPYFIEALSAVSSKSDASAVKVFDVKLMTKEQAGESLKTGGITGYVFFENGLHVAVKSSGLQQTILKEFADRYIQQTSAFTTIMSQNPSAHSTLRVSEAGSYLQKSENGSGGHTTVIMFYALISMAVMFGGFWGRREVEDIQANLSAQAARINMSPVHKLKAFVCSLSVSLLIHIVSLLVLIAFMLFVLGVDFGTQLGYVVLTCVVAGCMGVTFGAFLASLIRGSDSLRLAVLLSVSLLSSSLAGMVFPTIKYTVTEAVPILQYINPAGLVSDALYALYYYGPGPRFSLNIILMLVFTVVFSLVVYLVTRRQKYASL